MSAPRRIRRGAPPAKGRSPRKGAAPRRRSRIDQAIAALPVREETLRRLLTWTFFGAAVAVAVAIAAWAGVPGAVGVAAAEAMGRAGLRADQIEITGLKRMDRMSVYAVALDQQSRAMPLVDLQSVRHKLLRYGWIADAQVSRRLPDTLLVHIVERAPAAIWQSAGQLMLIDRDGVLLEPVALDAMPDLPLVIGPGANGRATDFTGLMRTAPKLAPMVQAATWIGDRRWNLRFDSGEELMLPEGEAEAVRALGRFARLDERQQLLGRGFARFDMRDPRRTYALPGGDGVRRAITDTDPAFAPEGAAMGGETG